MMMEVSVLGFYVIQESLSLLARSRTHTLLTLCNELFTELRTSSFFSYHTAAAPCVYEITYMHELAEVAAKMNIRCTLQEKEKT